LENPGLYGRITLKWIFEMLDGGIDWIDLAQDRERWRACCEYGDENSDSIKCGEFFETIDTF
jgi:hypothetical protein